MLTLLAEEGTPATASRSDRSTPSNITRRLRNGSAASTLTRRIFSRLARSSSSLLPLLAVPISPVSVSTTSPWRAELSCPPARLPSSTTCGVEALGAGAFVAASSLPPQAATATATTRASTTSRILRPTATLPSGSRSNSCELFRQIASAAEGRGSGAGRLGQVLEPDLGVGDQPALLVGDLHLPQLSGAPAGQRGRLGAELAAAHRPQEVGVVGDADHLAPVPEPQRPADAGRGLGQGGVDPAVHQAEGLVQVGGDRAGQYHPVAGGLLDPQPDQLDEAALELGVLGGRGGHGLLPVGPGRRRASARSRWITVRVRTQLSG